MGKKVSFPAWPFFDAERSKTLVERQDWLGRGWLLCYCCRVVMIKVVVVLVVLLRWRSRRFKTDDDAGDATRRGWENSKQQLGPPSKASIGLLGFLDGAKLCCSQLVGQGARG